MQGSPSSAQHVADRTSATLSREKCVTISPSASRSDSGRMWSSGLNSAQTCSVAADGLFSCTTQSSWAVKLYIVSLLPNTVLHVAESAQQVRDIQLAQQNSTVRAKCLPPACTHRRDRGSTHTNLGSAVRSLQTATAEHKMLLLRWAGLHTAGTHMLQQAAAGCGTLTAACCSS